MHDTHLDEMASTSLYNSFPRKIIVECTHTMQIRDVIVLVLSSIYAVKSSI